MSADDINPFEIVKDSSIWKDLDTRNALSRKDPYLRIGIVKKIFQMKDSNELRYLVETIQYGVKLEVNAKMMVRFGGIYNYEDYVNRGYKIDDKPDRVQDFSVKPGDIVIVAFLGGFAKDAVILGGLQHPGRKCSLDARDGPSYKSEFNGIEIHINKDGEYKLTFKGQPTNISKLSDIPTKKIEDPKYNENIAGSFLKFDKTGSFEINDSSNKNGIQFFKIDKQAGTIEISSGKISFKMNKKEEKVELTAKEFISKAQNKIESTTKDFSLKADSTVKIKSPKIALGNDGNELLDLVSQLADLVQTIARENSTEVHPTAVGPSGPPNNASAYTQAASKAKSIKSKIDSIKGSL